MRPKEFCSVSLFAIAVIVPCLNAPVLEAQETSAQEHLKLLKTYDLGKGIYSEGLDFHGGFLWHSDPGNLYKLDPDNATDVDYDGDYDLVPVRTWKFRHHNHSESSVWLDGELYNFTYTDLLGKRSDDIFHLNLNVDSARGNAMYGWRHVGDGLGASNWGSCRDRRNPGVSIIYTGHYDNLLLWFEPATGSTTGTLAISGLDSIEDLGMDRYGLVWASSYNSSSYPGLYRIDPAGIGEILSVFHGPDGLAIIDGIAIRSVEDRDVMYVTGKHSRYIWEYLVPPPPFDPVADVKVNGQDGPLTIGSGTNLIVDVSLDPGWRVGINADWWMLAASPSGWYRYSIPAVSYVPGFSVTWQGPLSACSNLVVSSGSGLPVGSYTFHFGVDMSMNGSIDGERAYHDTARVIVQ